jgi:hypothetical protein
MTEAGSPPWSTRRWEQGSTTARPGRIEGSALGNPARLPTSASSPVSEQRVRWFTGAVTTFVIPGTVASGPTSDKDLVPCGPGAGSASLTGAPAAVRHLDVVSRGQLDQLVRLRCGRADPRRRSPASCRPPLEDNQHAESIHPVAGGQESDAQKKPVITGVLTRPRGGVKNPQHAERFGRAGRSCGRQACPSLTWSHPRTELRTSSCPSPTRTASGADGWLYGFHSTATTGTTAKETTA